jgi:hypothetical protein
MTEDSGSGIDPEVLDRILAHRGLHHQYIRI